MTDKTIKTDLVQCGFFSPSMLLGGILTGRVYFSDILYSRAAPSLLSRSLNAARGLWTRVFNPPGQHFDWTATVSRSSADYGGDVTDNFVVPSFHAVRFYLI